MKQNPSTFMFSQSHIQGQHQIADFCVRYVHVLQIQCGRKDKWRGSSHTMTLKSVIWISYKTLFFYAI